MHTHPCKLWRSWTPGAGLFLALGPALAVHAQETPGAEEPPAFLRVSTARDTYFVQERIPLRVTLGFEREFFEDNLLPLFRQDLDIPAQIQAPWLYDLAGTSSLAGTDPPSGERGWRVAVNERIVEAVSAGEESVAGRTYRVFEFQRTLLPESAGTLILPDASMRIAYATRFREGLGSAKIPLDRREASVSASASGTTLTIRALPDRGAPVDFRGAVGRFTVRAEAAPRSIEVDESLKLTLTIEGAGNLGSFDLGPDPTLAGFRVYGRIEERGLERHVVTYDIAPTTVDVREVPALVFAYFDPHPQAPGYRLAETTPLAIQVVAPEPTAPGTGSPGAGAAGEGGDASLLFPVLAAVLAAGALGLALLALRRKRRSPRPAAPEARIVGAAAAFRERVAEADADVGDAFGEFLAACLSTTISGVVGAPHLPRRLEIAGVPGELALRADVLLGELGHERYGGSEAPQGLAAAQRLVDAIEAVAKAGD